MSETKNDGAMTALGCAAVLTVLIVIVLAVWGIVALATGSDSSDQEPEHLPLGPMVQVTVYGDGKYTGDECEALRVSALSNDNPHASDDLVQYDVHCKPIHLYDSPAPEATR